MSTDPENSFLSVKIAELLPYLRRYARALTGSQKSGDAHAAATLEALLTDRSVFDLGLSDKVALFRTFHAIWSSAGAPVQGTEEGLAASAQAHLSRLTANSREALLLHTIEEFPVNDVAASIRFCSDTGGISAAPPGPACWLPSAARAGI